MLLQLCQPVPDPLSSVSQSPGTMEEEGGGGGGGGGVSGERERGRHTHTHTLL